MTENSHLKSIQTSMFMKLFSLALALLLPTTGLVAQFSLEAKVQSEALILRRDMADAVANGSEKSAVAVLRLKQEKSPTGLKLDSDADFSFAALDVGRRLIAAGKPEAAEMFFREAEKSLDALVQRTPDTEALAKTEYLQKLALLRSNYLNKVDQAKRDIDQAVALRPDDPILRRAKDLVANENADAGKTPKKQ